MQVVRAWRGLDQRFDDVELEHAFVLARFAGTWGGMPVCTGFALVLTLFDLLINATFCVGSPYPEAAVLLAGSSCMCCVWAVITAVLTYYYMKPARREAGVQLLPGLLLLLALVDVALVTTATHRGRVVGLLQLGADRPARELKVFPGVFRLSDETGPLLHIDVLVTAYALFMPLRTYEIRWLIGSPALYAASLLAAGGGYGAAVDILFTSILALLTCCAISGASHSEYTKRQLFVLARQHSAEASALRELGALLQDASFVVDPAGRVLSADAAFQEMFGASDLSALMSAGEVRAFLCMLDAPGASAKTSASLCGRTAAGPVYVDCTLGGVRGTSGVHVGVVVQRTRARSASQSSPEQAESELEVLGALRVGQSAEPFSWLLGQPAEPEVRA